MANRRNLPSRPTGLLASLKLTEEQRVTIQSGGVDRFVERLEEQIKWAEMTLNGEELPMTGEARKMPPRLMHWKKAGSWFITVVYGTMPVDLSGDTDLLKETNASLYQERAQSTIEAGEDLEAVIATYETLIKAATETKELVPIIEHVAQLIASKLERKPKPVEAPKGRGRGREARVH